MHVLRRSVELAVTPALAIFFIQNEAPRLSSGQLRTFTRRQAMTFGWQLYYQNPSLSEIVVACIKVEKPGYCITT